MRPDKPDKSAIVTVELPRAKIMGRGWFSVVFALSPVETVPPAAAPSEFRTRMAIVTPDSRFASNALPAQTPSDYGYAGLLGMKCVRESHNMREYFPERGKINWKPLDEVMERASSEAKKYGVMWFFQANERPAWCSEADYEQIAFEMVSRCKDRCKTWEVENEPNFRYKPADYVTKALVPFAKGAKRADPSCTIIGPACVSVPLTLQFMQAIQEADALKYLDGVSTHTYMGPGELWELFGNPLYLQKLQDMAGNRPLWQTEQGYNWGQRASRNTPAMWFANLSTASGRALPTRATTTFIPSTTALNLVSDRRGISGRQCRYAGTGSGRRPRNERADERANARAARTAASGRISTPVHRAHRQRCQRRRDRPLDTGLCRKRDP